MLALVDNVPKVLSLKDALILCGASAQRRHAPSLICARRLTVRTFCKGCIAVDNTDEVVSIIRSSPNVPEAKAALMECFSAADVKNMLAAAGVTISWRARRGCPTRRLPP